jgi:hypothetical protein
MSKTRKYIIKTVALSDNEDTIKFLEKLTIRAKIDGLSFSKLVGIALNEYLQHHPVPNPQLLMAYYAKPEECQPMRVLCIYCQGAISDGKVFCQKKEMWIGGVACYGCRFNKLRKK